MWMQLRTQALHCLPAVRTVAVNAAFSAAALQRARPVLQVSLQRMRMLKKLLRAAVRLPLRQGRQAVQEPACLRLQRQQLKRCQQDRLLSGLHAAASLRSVHMGAASRLVAAR